MNIKRAGTVQNRWKEAAAYKEKNIVQWEKNLYINILSLYLLCFTYLFIYKLFHWHMCT